MIKKAIKVEGMTCAMCAKTIENSFSDMDSVSVNVGAGKVLAEYDPDKIDLSDIAQRINDAGYKALLDDQLNDNERIRHKMKREVMISLAFSLPLLWAMFGHIPLFDFLFVPAILMNGWFQLVVSGVVQFYIGKRFYVSAYRAIKKKVLGMDILVVLGTTSAYLYSMYLLYQHTFVETMMHPEYYFEISALIISMVLLGNYFEHVAKEKTTDALVELLNLGAKEARIIQDGEEKMVPIEMVEVGDHILVKSHEKIPVDGIIVKGSSYVDESMITGESIPVLKDKNQNVIGATLNTEESITIKTTKVGSDTMLSQIISTVEEASAKKLPIQRTADKIAAWFVPLVVSIAIFNFLLHFFILNFAFEPSFTRSVAILVISCPCALGLATPTSILVGNGKAAQHHILYKGGEFFELANKIEAIAFDKTGTLTYGKPEVTDFKGDEKALRYVYWLENESTHPISLALKAYANDQKGEKLLVESFTTVKGKGIHAQVGDKHVAVGSKKLMDELDIKTDEYHAHATKWLDEAKTVNYVSIEGECIAAYAVRDELKETSKDVIKAMQARGLKTVMITGDHEKVATAIAKELGIDKVYAEVLPHEKANIVETLQEEGLIVAFVGDGINDAPALKLADIGIAMGYGTDVAIDSSDVTLMSHDLGLVIKAIEMSKATLRNIHQNFFWAFSYNFVAIPLAAMGYLSMVLAAVAMGFSSITVVLNALRLKTTKLPDFKPEKGGNLHTMELKVNGMTCNHCKKTVETALKEAGYDSVEVDLDQGVVRLEAEDVNPVKEIIEAKGYTVVTE